MKERLRKMFTYTYKSKHSKNILNKSFNKFAKKNKKTKQKDKAV